MSKTKKILGSSLAAVLSSQSLWALDLDLSKIKVDGSIMIKGVSTAHETLYNKTINDQRNTTLTGVTLGVGGELSQGVMTRVEMVRKPLTTTNGVFGQAAQTPHGELLNLTIEEANLHLGDIFWGISAKLGRQYYGSADSLIGYAGHYDDDSMTVNGVDGLDLNKKVGPVMVDLFHAATNDTKTGLTGATALDSANATAVIGGRRSVKQINLMANVKELTGNDMLNIPVAISYSKGVNSGTSTVTMNQAHLAILAINAGASFMDGMVGVGLDWATNTGHSGHATKVDYKGTLTAVNVNYMNKDIGFSAKVDWANSSGDDGSSATQDKSFHDLSSFGMAPRKNYGEILGRTNNLGGGGTPILQGLDSGSTAAAGAGLNVLSLMVGYKLPVMDNKWSVDYAYISAKSNKLPVGSTLEKSIGTEVDLSLSYNHSENVMWGLGVAQFSPKANSFALGNGVANDKVQKLFAMASVKF